ncbi:hypothetical protein ASPTUDRAFT_76485 [Aspergillus tubingensis CBS 134.48]|uniref:Uncharacterized protein n=1 Tax=Aspergillus tubingensis (strain CBS 134.48) TaxID=767770 RepID=A0A1L9N1A2_ASPTC|nr:hypothetical protein ASPTUDRAFT_76485 [Aspergillus tubingensis CBS 134.48]
MRSRQPWELLRTDDFGRIQAKWKNGEEKEKREREGEGRERDRRYGNESQSVQSSVRAQKVCDAHPVTRWFERKQVKCERSAVRNYPVRCVVSYPNSKRKGGLLSSGTTSEPAQLTVNLGCLRRRPTKWGRIAERRQPPSTESMDHTPPTVRWRADASCPVYKALYLSL